MTGYTYKPGRFFVIVFLFTWAFWIAAAVFGHFKPDNSLILPLMLLGLFVPSITALCMVLTSKNSALKKDYVAKLCMPSRLRPLNILSAIALILMLILASIAVSLLFGQSTEQFALVEGFSFSVGGIPTLLTLILAASLEELGWRGYAQDAIAQRGSWFRSSLIFGALWGLWHLPLFFIPDTYQYTILHENVWYMVNFFLSVIPIVFIVTWVYVKNNRSILACVIFHFFMNFFQEQIAMTQTTKCIETGIFAVAALILILSNRDMFFEIRHVGRILDEESTRKKEKTLR